MVLDKSETLLFTGSEDTTIRLSDLGYKKSLGVFNGHTNRVKSLVVSSN